MRIGLFVLLWCAIGVFPAGLGLWTGAPVNLTTPDEIEGHETTVTSNGGTLGVPDGEE